MDVHETNFGNIINLVESGLYIRLHKNPNYIRLFMKIKTYKRADNEGTWQQVSNREHDSTEWNEQDSVWINHIIKENINYLTNEDVMYSKIDD